MGISAVLSQNGRIVQFASRAQSAVEQRYSQTEREALAITCTCEHFHIYIFGDPFTPLWPQANAETERFMRTVKKSIKTALNKGRSWKQKLFKFLLNYRTTPRCTTGAPPATILFGRTIKNRLPHLITPIAEDSSIRERDTKAKRKIKQYADRKAYVKPNDFRVGDTVIVKSDNTSKAPTPYQPNPMTIIKKKGSMITATHKGNHTTRNSSFFKKIPKPTTNPTHNLTGLPLNFTIRSGLLAGIN